MLRNLLLLSILIFVSSCGSQEITIRSTPEQADVFIAKLGKGEREKIGQTPMTLDEDTMKKLSETKDTLVVLEIERSGYMREQIIVNDFGSTNVEYDFSLKTNNIANVIKDIDSVSENLFKAQKLMRSGGYDDSLKILTDLDKKFPYSSVINELIGGAHFFKKQYKNSLIYYDLAYKYDPKNIDAYKMLQYLENELGVKRPLMKDVKGVRQ